MQPGQLLFTENNFIISRKGILEQKIVKIERTFPCRLNDKQKKEITLQRSATFKGFPFYNWDTSSWCAYFSGWSLLYNL